MKTWLVALTLFLIAPVAEAGSTVLNWKDNSGNETEFNIERKQAACADTSTIFIEIAKVGAGVTTFTDNSAAEGATFCYRVAASNAAGKSAFSNAVAITVPFTVPAAPSGLTVTPGP